MADETKVTRVDMSEEEMTYLIHSLNLVKSIVTRDLTGQLSEVANINVWLYSDGGGKDSRIDRLNQFHIRFAKLAVGEERVAQVIKDYESEVHVKGFTKCPDCGGYHA